MEETSAFRQALEQLQRGDLAAARQTAMRGVSEARGGHGAESAEAAVAEFELAKILLGSGDLGGAAAALRRAWSIPGRTEAAEKDRLTYNMNLGEVLQRLGRLDEAEQVLREGHAARLTFYGPDHPGVAFGLEPLADVLQEKGADDEALALVDRAVQILADARHERVAPALALRAVIARSLGRQGFDADLPLPEELLDTLVAETLARADRDEPAVSLQVLQDLQALLAARRGADDDWAVHVGAAITTVAGRAGAHEVRQQTFRWLIDALGARGRLSEQLGAVNGLALAQSDAGDPAGAEQSYRRALELAGTQGEAARAQVLRNFGLFLADCERRDEARPLLAEAVKTAGRTGDAVEEGRAAVAYGIFRQHENALDEARALLGRALSLLPPSHPDTLYARSHLQAIERGGGCGCGNMDQAIGEALQAMVKDQLPEGLLRNISVRFDEEGTPQIEVELGREPRPEELEQLEAVVRGATATLQQKIRRRGMGS